MCPGDGLCAKGGIEPVHTASRADGRAGLCGARDGAGAGPAHPAGPARQCSRGPRP